MLLRSNKGKKEMKKKTKENESMKKQVLGRDLRTGPFPWLPGGRPRLSQVLNIRWKQRPVSLISQTNLER